MSDDTRRDMRFVRSPHVLQRRTLDTFVLLGVDSEEPVIVGGTGADVWTLLAEARTLDELVDLLAEHYAGDRAVITADVSALLDTFVNGGVVLQLNEAGRRPWCTAASHWAWDSPARLAPCSSPRRTISFRVNERPKARASSTTASRTCMRSMPRTRSEPAITSRVAAWLR